MDDAPRRRPDCGLHADDGRAPGAHDLGIRAGATGAVAWQRKRDMLLVGSAAAGFTKKPKFQLIAHSLS